MAGGGRRILISGSALLLVLFFILIFIIYLNHEFVKPQSLQVLVIGAPVSPGSQTPAMEIRMMKLSGDEGYSDVPP